MVVDVLLGMKCYKPAIAGLESRKSLVLMVVELKKLIIWVVGLVAYLNLIYHGISTTTAGVEVKLCNEILLEFRNLMSIVSKPVLYFMFIN